MTMKELRAKLINHTIRNRQSYNVKDDERAILYPEHEGYFVQLPNESFSIEIDEKTELDDGTVKILTTEGNTWVFEFLKPTKQVTVEIITNVVIEIIDDEDVEAFVENCNYDFHSNAHAHVVETEIVSNDAVAETNLD
jgi:hypothetical protein